MPHENGTTGDRLASQLRRSWGERPSVHVIVTADFEQACSHADGTQIPDSLRGVGVYRSGDLYFVPLEPKAPPCLYAEFEGLLRQNGVSDSAMIRQLPGSPSVLRNGTFNLDADGNFQVEKGWESVDTPWPKLLVWFHEQCMDLFAGKDGDQSGSWRCLLTLVADAIESLTSITIADRNWNQTAQQFRNMTLRELAEQIASGKSAEEPPRECSSDIDWYTAGEAIRDLCGVLCRRRDVSWWSPGNPLTPEAIRGPLYDMLRQLGNDAPADLKVSEAAKALIPPRVEDDALDLTLSWAIEEFGIKESRDEILPESPFLTTLRNQLVLLGVLDKGAPLSSSVLDVQCVNLLCEHPKIDEPDDARNLQLSEASDVLAELRTDIVGEPGDGEQKRPVHKSVHSAPENGTQTKNSENRHKWESKYRTIVNYWIAEIQKTRKKRARTKVIRDFLTEKSRVSLWKGCAASTINQAFKVNSEKWSEKINNAVEQAKNGTH